MKKILLLVCALLFAASLTMYAGDYKLKGGFYILPGATSDLKVPAISGKDSYKNDGTYFGGYADIAVMDKVSIGGTFINGQAKEIDGGSAFVPMQVSTSQTIYVPGPNFNPENKEKVTITDFYLGLNLFKNPIVGKIDATAGFFRLYAAPDIPPANWYSGLSYGIKGEWNFADVLPNTIISGLTLDYRVTYVPHFEVNGSVAGKLEAKDITMYRVGLEYMPVASVPAGIMLGYTNMNLRGEAIYVQPYLDQNLLHSKAEVVYDSFYVGVMTKF